MAGDVETCATVALRASLVRTMASVRACASVIGPAARDRWARIGFGGRDDLARAYFVRRDGFLAMLMWIRLEKAATFWHESTQRLRRRLHTGS